MLRYLLVLTFLALRTRRAHVHAIHRAAHPDAARAMSNPPPEPIVLRAHRSDAQCASFDASGVLYTGDADGEVVRWDVERRRVVHRARAHGPTSGVLAMAHFNFVSRASSRAGDGSGDDDVPTRCTQGRDGSVKYWRRAGDASDDRGVEIASRTIRGGVFGFCRLVSDGDELIARATCARGSVVVERAETGRAACALPALGKEDDESDPRAGVAMCISFIRSEHVVVGYEDGTIAIWALDFESGRGEVKWRRRTHKESALCADVDALGEGFVTGGADGTLVRYAVDVNVVPLMCEVVRAHGPYAEVITSSSKQPGVSACAIRGDGKIVASGCWDGKIRVYEYKRKSKGRVLAVLKYHAATVTDVLFAPDDSYLVSTARDGAVALWPIFPPSE